MQSIIVFLVVSISVASAVPSLLVQDEEGQEFQLTPVLNRQRREKPQIYGGGFAAKHVQSGLAGVQNPNGSGGSVGYTHGKGYGRDVSVDAMVPVWSSKNGWGESTINAGGGVSRHYGGYGGSRTTDKRFGLNFNHRF